MSSFSQMKEQLIYALSNASPVNRDSVIPTIITDKQLDETEGTVKLPVVGKGTVSFEIRSTVRKLSLTLSSIDDRHHMISLLDDAKKSLIQIKITNRNVCIVGDDREDMFEKNLAAVDFDLVHFKSSSCFLWVSVNDDGILKLGHGYMMEQTRLVTFVAKHLQAFEMLKNVVYVKFDKYKSVVQAKVRIVPVTVDLSPIIVNQHTSYLKHDTIPVGELPSEIETLYEYVKDVHISVEDAFMFNYSCDADGGGVLYSKLRSKLGTGSAKQACIRLVVESQSADVITIYEFWPKTHFSPVHSHGDVYGVAKVLHGNMECIWYNPMSDVNVHVPREIKRSRLCKGDIAWMAPEFYQTHKLSNTNAVSLAITVQCYKYNSLAHDNKQQEVFNYITDGDPIVKRSNPKADFDMSFSQLKEIVAKEYINRERRDYTVSIKTGKKTGAATDSNVVLMLCGSFGKSEVLELSNSNNSNKFRQGQTDTFEFNLPALGRLLSVKIWHDNSGTNPAWYLESVTVTDNKAGKKYNFTCCHWLDAKRGVKDICRDLRCDEMDNKKELLVPFGLWGENDSTVEESFLPD